jgi:hypothetical protein
MKQLRKRPSATLVIAMLALFVALGGTAGAVVTAAVPLAKRALVADNAKKVNGLTAVQIGAAAAKAGAAAAATTPGPASTASGLVTTKSAPFSLAPGGEGPFTATCDSGSKAVGGAFTSPTSALVIVAESAPTADGAGWTQYLLNLSSSSAGSGTVVAVCLK